MAEIKHEFHSERKLALDSPFITELSTTQFGFCILSAKTLGSPTALGMLCLKLLKFPILHREVSFNSQHLEAKLIGED